ncbi:unnamed protein product [Echinostoma caproni]|uniref:Phospholipid-transporting ATPase n=1 Tax=Echinostoma caproni TaxID=27848 RepID=A0A183AFA3_9TREM|nr:unnamed protein product [Echinostoma caproni]
MGLTMIKDGISDVHRHKNDKILNNKQFVYLNIDMESSSMVWMAKESHAIVVGNIIRCEKNDEFPCDMLILASSDPKRKVEVTTANLDGETSLKTHFAHVATQDAFLRLANIDENVAYQSLPWLDKLLISVECEEPTPDLRHFEGKLKVEAESSSGDNVCETVLFENILLRGAKLKNTEYIIGMPIYTGKDTKLSLNSQMVSRKFTSRESKLNTNLIGFGIASLSLSILFTIATGLWAARNMEGIWYLQSSNFTAWRFIQGLFLYSFTANTLVHISLLTSLEVVQMFLASFISNDNEMYDCEQQLGSTTKTIHVADELGQVEYLFSDKTGTLTKNIMTLKSIAVFPSNRTYVVRNENQLMEVDQPLGRSEHRRLGGDDTFELPDRKLLDKMPPELEKLLTVASLCHTIEVEETKKSPEQIEKEVYHATSPDELALVTAAANLGLVLTAFDVSDDCFRMAELMRRNWTNRTNQPEYEKLNYQIDAILEFDSTRKRMSVMVRHPDGTYHIHSKGAESSMLAPEASISSSSDIQTQVLDRVSEFAISGLRTLVLASRELRETEYKELLMQWNTSIQLFGEERKNAVNKIRNRIESGLELVGVTGVDDVLSPGVPECLTSLRQAGIKIWVLTGDKEQTAITVSQAAGHIPHGMSIFRMTHCENIGSAARRIFELLEGLNAIYSELCPSGNSADGLTDVASLDEINEVLETAAQAEILHKLQVSGVSSIGKDHQDMATIVAEIEKLRASLMQFTNPKKRNKRLFRRKLGAYVPSAGVSMGLVIDGESLAYALEPALCPAFLDLCLSMNAVLCCRMTPIQKAFVVEMVREGIRKRDSGRPPVTAAIGDGGNDVAMIHQASVGIGLYGREGREACNSIPTDSEFKFRSNLFLILLPNGNQHLKRLLLVHGHWCQHRVTHTMLLFYYKNTLFVTARMLAIVFAAFSGTAWIDSMQVILYSLTFTTLAPIAYGSTEKPFTAQQLLRNPTLYAKISRHRSLRPENLILYVLDGIWQGAVVFFCVYHIYGGGSSYASGKFFQRVDGKMVDYDVNMVSTAFYFLLVICVNLRVTIHMRDWNVFYLGALILTLVLNVIIYLVIQFTSKPTSPQANIYTNVIFNLTFWLSVPVIVFTALLPATIWRFISDHTWKKDLNAVQHVEERKSQERISKYVVEDESRSSEMTDFTKS